MLQAGGIRSSRGGTIAILNRVIREGPTKVNLSKNQKSLSGPTMEISRGNVFQSVETVNGKSRHACYRYSQKSMDGGAGLRKEGRREKMRPEKRVFIRMVGANCVGHCRPCKALWPLFSVRHKVIQGFRAD